MSRDPEVLRDLAERLKRTPRPSVVDPNWTFGDEVHEIPRDELVRAYDGGVLELDRFATGVLIARGE
jgi:hypothetical protein